MRKVGVAGNVRKQPKIGEWVKPVWVGVVGKKSLV